MKIRELEKGKIIVEDYTTLDFYHPSEKIQETKPLNNPLLISEFKKDVDVLQPVDDGEEFLVKHIGEINKALSDSYTNFSFKDRYYGDIFPEFKEVIYPYLKEAYRSKKAIDLKYFYHKNNILKFIVNSKIIYENGEIWILNTNVTASEEETIFDFDYFDENHIIEKYYKSITNQESSVISYDFKRDHFACPHKIYKLMGIDNPEEYDKDRIFDELMFEEDVKYMREQIATITQEDSQRTFNVRISTPNHLIKTIRCFLYGLFDEEGKKLEKMFLFLKDVTDYDLTEDNLKDLNNNIHVIQTLTRAAIYHLDMHGHYVWNSNIREIIEAPGFDYKTDYNIIRDLVLDEDKQILEEGLNSMDSYNPIQNFKIRIRTLKGNIKLLNLIIKRVYDGDENIITSSIQVFDITKGTVENNFIKLVNAFNAVSPHLKIAVIYGSNKGVFRPSKVVDDILGIDYRTWNHGGKEIFFENLINADFLKEKLKQLNNHEIDEFEVVLKYKFNGDPNDIRIINNYMYRDETKEVSGYIEDITEATEREENLKKLNEDKSILLKEIHHRVKNNLQVLASLLNLEERFYRNNPEEILKSTKKRLNSIALVHEMTYGSVNIETVNLKEYFEIFDRDIFGIYSNDHFIIKNDVDEDSNLPLTKVTPLVLIINELISNSIKYAFDFENSESVNKITKKISFEGDKCIVEYKDNGKGLPEGFDINNSSGLGWTIINSFVRQLDGEMEEIESDGIGLRLTFPINGD